MKILTNEEYAAFCSMRERMGMGGGSPPPIETHTERTDGKFLAKITGYAGGTGYAWKRVYPDPANKGQFIDWTPAETGNNAWERNLSAGVPSGTVVELQVVDYENSGGAARFEFAATIDTRFKITAHTQDGSNKRWTYTARRQVKTSAGYGGWAADADVADYTLFNSIEVINGASGLYGNGVSSSNLPASPATMDIQPAPNGIIVRGWPVTFTPSGGSATTEWWFSYENGVDGSCA